MARRYDSSTTTFSPEGRLHQVRWLVGLLVVVSLAKHHVCGFAALLLLLLFYNFAVTKCLSHNKNNHNAVFVVVVTRGKKPPTLPYYLCFPRSNTPLKPLIMPARVSDCWLPTALSWPRNARSRRVCWRHPNVPKRRTCWRRIWPVTWRA